MKEEYKNIIFDWSGVINDNWETTLLTANKLFKHFNVPEITSEEFRREWIQPFMLFYNKYLPDLSLKEEQRLYKKYYNEIIKEHHPYSYSGIVEVLKECKRLNKNMFVVSSDPLVNITSEIVSFDLENIFTEIEFGAHNKLNGVKRIIDKYGLAPKETIFVGDTDNEADVSNELSLISISVTWGLQDEEKIKKANPNYIARNINEFKEILGIK
ncbi:HAD family hydrolase [bacterium]|jgi:phosphoglycolate phosphatase|nr:HAD family hydrolase [bacterium]MBT4121455.1 HAD family hydrolase [bacterium]MBT4335452.1 HAD family hydrolase [bacterium]MBT4495594.1 HAD family hydrolase [bacterium]MBT4764252.1 HAD family hydrolase [bacterium]